MTEQGPQGEQEESKEKLASNLSAYFKNPIHIAQKEVRAAERLKTGVNQIDGRNIRGDQELRHLREKLMLLITIKEDMFEMLGLPKPEPEEQPDEASVNSGN